jgi:hypothetical protein
MNQETFHKMKLLIIFCLLVFGATYFAQSQMNAATAALKQIADLKIPNERIQPKSVEGLIYSGGKLQSQTTSLTGTYLYKGKGRKSEIKVLQTRKDEIKVSFEGIYQYEIPGGHLNTRTGGFEPETIKLEKGRAVWTPEEGCLVTLTFSSGNRLKALQSASGCELPWGVTADGVYRKISSKEPYFPDPSGISPDAVIEDAVDTTAVSPSKRVRFPRGADSVMVSGNIEGGTAVSYIVGARAGQTINVQVIDGGAENDVVVAVEGKNGTKLKVDDNDGKFFTGRTLKTGDYIIAVNTAGTQNTNFKISVTIY